MIFGFRPNTLTLPPVYIIRPPHVLYVCFDGASNFTVWCVRFKWLSERPSNTFWCSPAWYLLSRNLENFPGSNYVRPNCRGMARSDWELLLRWDNIMAASSQKKSPCDVFLFSIWPLTGRLFILHHKMFLSSMVIGHGRHNLSNYCSFSYRL